MNKKMLSMLLVAIMVCSAFTALSLSTEKVEGAMTGTHISLSLNTPTSDLSKFPASYLLNYWKHFPGTKTVVGRYFTLSGDVYVKTASGHQLVPNARVSIELVNPVTGDYWILSDRTYPTGHFTFRTKLNLPGPNAQGQWVFHAHYRGDSTHMSAVKPLSVYTRYLTRVSIASYGWIDDTIIGRLMYSPDGGSNWLPLAGQPVCLYISEYHYFSSQTHHTWWQNTNNNGWVSWRHSCWSDVSYEHYYFGTSQYWRSRSVIAS